MSNYNLKQIEDMCLRAILFGEKINDIFPMLEQHIAKEKERERERIN